MGHAGYRLLRVDRHRHDGGFDDYRQLQAVIDPEQHHKQRDPPQGRDLRQRVKQRLHATRRTGNHAEQRA